MARTIVRSRWRASFSTPKGIARPVGDDRLDQDLDTAAAGQPNRPGLFVLDAELQATEFPVPHGGLGLLDHRPFDTPARHGAHKRSIVAHRDRTTGPGAGLNPRC